MGSGITARFSVGRAACLVVAVAAVSGTDGVGTDAESGHYHAGVAVGIDRCGDQRNGAIIERDRAGRRRHTGRRRERGAQDYGLAKRQRGGGGQRYVGVGRDISRGGHFADGDWGCTVARAGIDVAAIARADRDRPSSENWYRNTPPPGARTCPPPSAAPLPYSRRWLWRH